MSALIRKWELDDSKSSEFVYGGGYSQKDADPDWQSRYEEAIVAGDYIASRYAKQQLIEVLEKECINIFWKQHKRYSHNLACRKADLENKINALKNQK